MTAREKKAMELRIKYNSPEFVFGGEAINRALDGIHPLDSLFLEMAEWTAEQCAYYTMDDKALTEDVVNAGTEEAV